MGELEIKVGGKIKAAVSDNGSNGSNAIMYRSRCVPLLDSIF